MTDALIQTPAVAVAPVAAAAGTDPVNTHALGVLTGALPVAQDLGDGSDTSPAELRGEAQPAGLVLEVHVFGEPAAQGSKRSFVNQHTGRAQTVDASKRTRPWREAVKQATLDRLDLDWIARNGPLCAGPVAVTIVFTFGRPRSHYRTGRNAHLLRDNAPAYPVTTIDVDKAVRACFDSLTDAGAWRDDKQAVKLTAAKTYPGGHRYALPRPGAVIRLHDLSASPSAISPGR